MYIQLIEISFRQYITLARSTDLYLVFPYIFLLKSILSGLEIDILPKGLFGYIEGNFCYLFWYTTLVAPLAQLIFCE